MMVRPIKGVRTSSPAHLDLKSAAVRDLYLRTLLTLKQTLGRRAVVDISMALGK